MTVYNSEQVQNRGHQECQDISNLVSSTEKLSIICSLSNHQSQVEQCSVHVKEISKRRKEILGGSQNEEQIDNAKEAQVVENAVAPHNFDGNENNGLMEKGHSDNFSQERVKADNQKDDSDVEWNHICITTKEPVGLKDEKKPIDKDAKDTPIDKNAVIHNDADRNEKSNDFVEKGHLNNLGQEKIKLNDQKDSSDVEWNHIHIPTNDAVTVIQKTQKVCSGSDEEKSEDEELEEKSEWCIKTGEEEHSDDENEPDEDEPVKEGNKQTPKHCLKPDDEKNEEDEGTEGEEKRDKIKERNKYEVTGEEEYSDDENQQDDDDDEFAKEEKKQPKLLQRGWAGFSQQQHYAEQNNCFFTTWQGTNGGYVASPSSYYYDPNEAVSHQPQHHAQQNGFPEAQWQDTSGNPLVAPVSYVVPNYGYVLSKSPEVAQPANYPEISSMQEAMTESHIYDKDEYNTSSSGSSSPEQDTKYQSVIPDQNDIELVLEVVKKVNDDDKYLPVPALILKGILDYFETPSADNPKLVWGAQAVQCDLPSQQTSMHLNSSVIPIHQIQDNLMKKSDSMWKKNLNNEKLLQYRKYLAKMSNEVLTAKDKDGDTPLLIVASRTDSYDYMEKLVAMVERQKDILMCCDKLVSESRICSNCGNTDENTFYSPLSMRNNQCDSILSCVIKMQCSESVINYISEKIRHRIIDLQRLSDQSSLIFYSQVLDKYPGLSVFFM